MFKNTNYFLSVPKFYCYFLLTEWENHDLMGVTYCYLEDMIINMFYNIIFTAMHKGIFNVQNCAEWNVKIC